MIYKYYEKFDKLHRKQDVRLRRKFIFSTFTWSFSRSSVLRNSLNSSSFIIVSIVMEELDGNHCGFDSTNEICRFPLHMYYKSEFWWWKPCLLSHYSVFSWDRTTCFGTHMSDQYTNSYDHASFMHTQLSSILIFNFFKC